MYEYKRVRQLVPGEDWWIKLIPGDAHRRKGKSRWTNPWHIKEEFAELQRDYPDRVYELYFEGLLARVLRVK